MEGTLGSDQAPTCPVLLHTQLGSQLLPQPGWAWASDGRRGHRSGSFASSGPAPKESGWFQESGAHLSAGLEVGQGLEQRALAAGELRPGWRLKGAWAQWGPAGAERGTRGHPPGPECAPSERRLLESLLVACGPEGTSSSCGLLPPELGAAVQTWGAVPQGGGGLQLSLCPSQRDYRVSAGEEVVGLRDQ